MLENLARATSPQATTSRSRTAGCARRSSASRPASRATRRVEVVLRQVADLARKSRLRLPRVKTGKPVAAARYMEQPLDMDDRGRLRRLLHLPPEGREARPNHAHPRPRTPAPGRRERLDARPSSRSASTSNPHAARPSDERVHGGHRPGARGRPRRPPRGSAATACRRCSRPDEATPAYSGRGAQAPQLRPARAWSCWSPSASSWACARWAWPAGSSCWTSRSTTRSARPSRRSGPPQEYRDVLERPRDRRRHLAGAPRGSPDEPLRLAGRHAGRGHADARPQRRPPGPRGRGARAPRARSAQRLRRPAPEQR